MAILASVQNGELIYDYTDNSKKNQLNPTGSTLGYDQFLQLLCAEMQNQDPLEPTTNTEYVAQMATFSQLEATLSMSALQESNMANSLVGKQVILKLTSETTGDTSYVDGKVDYILYQNGEVLLSVNDGLYPLDSLDTVADSQYYDAIAVSKVFEGMVGKLPYMENLTVAWKKGIEELRTMYDEMSDYEKSFVDSDVLQVLTNYENRIKELEKIEESANGSTDNSGNSENTENPENTDVV